MAAHYIVARHIPLMQYISEYLGLAPSSFFPPSSSSSSSSSPSLLLASFFLLIPLCASFFYYIILRTKKCREAPVSAPPPPLPTPLFLQSAFFFPFIIFFVHPSSAPETHTVAVREAINKKIKIKKFKKLFMHGRTNHKLKRSPPTKKNKSLSCFTRARSNQCSMRLTSKQEFTYQAPGPWVKLCTFIIDG